MKMLSFLNFLLITINTLSSQNLPPDDLNWDLDFEDEFNGSQLDPNEWEIANNFDHYGSSCELQIYTDRSDNVSVSGGKLIITAKEESYSYNGNNYDYTSGWVESYRKWKYGYFEVKAEMNGGKGLWHSFWFHTGSCSIDWEEELDVYETDGRYTDQYGTNVHDYSNGICSDNGHISQNIDCPDYTYNANVYGMEWGPEYIKWYLNGNLVRTIDNSYPIDHELDVILDFSIRSSLCSGPPNKYTVFPSNYKIYYFKAYQLDLDCNNTVTVINDFLNFNYGVKKAFELDGGTNVPTGYEVTFRATDYFELDDEFEVPSGTSMAFIPTNCY